MKSISKFRIVCINIGAILLLSVLLFVLLGHPVNLKNKYDFGQSVINAAKATDFDEITLNEIVPFQWDIVYSFSPYTSRQEMERIIGVKSLMITETVSEGMVQLIFVKDGKVVCGITGYGQNLGYDVILWSDPCDGGYALVRFEDHVPFSVERNGHVITLTRVDGVCALYV